MLINELLTYLFDGKPHLLAEPMSTWLASSRRFAAFVNAHHTKIRKKLRVAQGEENIRDLQLELETAYLLLRERSLSLAYEPQHPELGRSPDFAVTFTTSFTFMVEVTRMRTAQSKSTTSIQETSSGTLSSDRFTDMLCSKLGQLLSKRGNLLLIGVESSPLADYDLRAIMLRIQQRAESNDSTVIHKHGFRDRADFFQHYQRLNAILVRQIPLQASESVLIWNNPQTKYPLPAKVYTALSRSHML
jgi:hypothetical protein